MAIEPPGYVFMSWLGGAFTGCV